MLGYVSQLWRSEDLRKRILITLGLLVVYRIAAHVPVPTADAYALNQFFSLSSSGAAGALGIFTALTGGSIDNFSVMMLGLSPYINASIIIQLCTVIFPKLEALSKEGAQGQKEINRYTRWITLPLALMQSYGYLILLTRGSGAAGLVDTTFPAVLFPMIFVTAGSLFAMWLGELITEKGVGNGTSILIFVGIVSAIPTTIMSLVFGGTTDTAVFAFFGLVSIALLIAVVLFTDAHRLIPITYANQGAGRGVQGSLPIRLLQAGMVPIIFAVSLIAFPAILAEFLRSAPRFSGVVAFITKYLDTANPSLFYIVAYFLLVILFTFFYVSVTFKPEEVSESIQKRGGFIPGSRPGAQTATLLRKVSSHLNLWGGIFLGVVAIIPLLFAKYTSLSSAELIISGSGLIIIVGVVMELIRQVNAQMLAHDYEKLV